METIKQGDTLPISGRIEIREYNEATKFYDEITDTIDFSMWSISCEVKDKVGAVVATVVLEFIDDGPAFSSSVPSSETLTWTVGDKYRIDIRFKDDTDAVNSTATREVKVIEAISVLP